MFIVSPIDVLSPLSTTQCPNRLQCRHKPCTISCYDTHMAQDACSFSEPAAVCTTVPPRVHDDVHLVTHKACHIHLAVACNDHKYHRNPISRHRHIIKQVINEVLMISRKWLFMFSSTPSSSSCLALSQTTSLPEKEGSTKKCESIVVLKIYLRNSVSLFKIIAPLFKRFSRGCPDSQKFPHTTRYQPPAHCFSESAPINHVFKFLIETFVINLSKGPPPGCFFFLGDRKRLVLYEVSTRASLK